MLEREVSMASSQASVEEERGQQASPVVSTIKPAVVVLPDNLTAMQVDCGTFHTGEL